MKVIVFYNSQALTREKNKSTKKIINKKLEQYTNLTIKKLSYSF